MKKGFTLIELLVVIAIIGILSSVVLASLSTARDRAKDQSASASLAQLKAQVEIVADGNDYAAVFTDPVDEDIQKLIDAAEEQTGNEAEFFDTATGWAISIPLTNDEDYYCVDSDGFSGKLAADPVLSDTNLTCE